jgi:anti-sigma-K factor RskA
VLAAATGQKAPRPAIFTRLFWAAAAVVLFALILNSLTDTSTKLTWTPQKPAPEVKGRMRWWKDGKVTLDVSGLPALPADKEYQLWHIGPIDRPVACRTFKLDASGVLDGEDTMKYAIAQGHKFALTVEPVGGSQAPTMPIFAIAQ